MLSKQTILATDQSSWIQKADKKDIIAIIDNAPFGIVINDPKTLKVLYINQACIDLSGYTIAEIPSGFDAQEKFFPDLHEREVFAKQCIEILTTGHAGGQCQIRTKDGRLKSVDVYSVYLEDKYIASMWKDVSAQTTAEQALREMNDRLEELLQERTSGLIEANQQLRLEINQKKKIEKELEQSREELRRLSEYIQNAREEERTHVAREVHDQLGQTLSALKIDISYLGQHLAENQQALQEKTCKMERQIDVAINAVRDICAELRPPILWDFGLPAAMEWYLDTFQKRTGIRYKMSFDPDIQTSLNNTDLVFFRILQEAMTNIMRHSKATDVTVELTKRPKSLTLIVKDNGIGITDKQLSDPRSFGIIGIRERVRFRGGQTLIKGIPNQGTTMTVTIPLNP